jgi:UDP-glucuronate 4-epimerase
VRDFTYIDDVVEAIARVLDKPEDPNPLWDSSHPDPDSSSAPYRIYNVGNSQPVKLMDFIEAIEIATGKKAKKIFLPMQPGDVYQTNADTYSLQETFNFKPHTNVLTGVAAFVDWYKDFILNNDELLSF